MFYRKLSSIILLFLSSTILSSAIASDDCDGLQGRWLGLATGDGSKFDCDYHATLNIVKSKENIFDIFIFLHDATPQSWCHGLEDRSYILKAQCLNNRITTDSSRWKNGLISKDMVILDSPNRFLQITVFKE